MRTAALTGLLLLACAGCVRFAVGRYRQEQPVAIEQLEQLTPGRDDLGSCLHVLGAPVYIFEWQRDGMALAWVWEDVFEWGLRVSLAFGRGPSASFSYDDADADRPGCMLWFDRDLVLREWRRGSMRDLVQQLRQRPGYWEDDPDFAKH